MREAQLRAARNMPEVRRVARDLVGTVVIVVAFLSAFVFVNVAAMDGLSRAMPTWAAALVLAGVWIVVAGGLLLVGPMRRARRWLGWLLFKAPPSGAVADLEEARDQAAAEVRATVERVGPALVVEIATAAVPSAGDVAGGLAGGVVEAGDSLLEVSDEIVEVIAAEIPGGGVVNQVWDVVLTPGRFGVRVATTVLKAVRPPAER
jgi:hypothetical protein